MDTFDIQAILDELRTQACAGDTELATIAQLTSRQLRSLPLGGEIDG